VLNLQTCYFPLSCNVVHSHLVSTHETGQLVDEEMDEVETRDLQQSELVCRSFLRWDLEGGDENEMSVKDILTRVLRGAIEE
jgi:DNA mismatch repair protein MSH5